VVAGAAARLVADLRLMQDLLRRLDDASELLEALKKAFTRTKDLWNKGSKEERGATIEHLTQHHHALGKPETASALVRPWPHVAQARRGWFTAVCPCRPPPSASTWHPCGKTPVTKSRSG
jgi:hypothetical protein